MKPILFNTEMVRAILEGRKTVTRRVVKPQPICCGRSIIFQPHDNDFCLLPESNWLHCRVCGNTPMYGIEGSNVAHHWTPPCHPGDILYVRETWAKQFGLYWHKAGLVLDENERWHGTVPPSKWRPSIHMPREAARLFLRVTDVRVERLQQIMERGLLSAQTEGFVNDIDIINGGGKSATKHFSELWDSTIKKTADRALYGWAANPWVWVIEFERCEKQEENT